MRLKSQDNLFFIYLFQFYIFLHFVLLINFNISGFGIDWKCNIFYFLLGIEREWEKQEEPILTLRRVEDEDP